MVFACLISWCFLSDCFGPEGNVTMANVHQMRGFTEDTPLSVIVAYAMSSNTKNAGCALFGVQLGFILGLIAGFRWQAEP